MASSLFIDLQGQPIPDSQVLGYGRSGVVVYSENPSPAAIKIPLRHPWSSNADVQSNQRILRHEQEVFQRFRSFEPDQIDGVVPCMGLYPDATHLAYMKNGDLRAYLGKHTSTRLQQISWFRQIARSLQQIHDKRVVVADIATRNLLLDWDLSIKICDFSEASMFPLGTPMDLADDDGFSVQTDIGQLGAVMYEVITGEKCSFNLFEDDRDDGRATWPKRSSLPSTDGIWLGSVIEKCWTEGGFKNTDCLLQELSMVNVNSEIDAISREQDPPHIQTSRISKTFQSPLFALVAVFGIFAIVHRWSKRC